MRLTVLALIFFAFTSSAQVVRINGSYGGAGINSFIGQRSWFLNDSSFKLTNGWSLGASVKIKTFSSGRLYLGLDFQSTQRLEFNRIKTPDGTMSVTSADRFNSIGIPVSFSTGQDSSRWSFAITVTPSYAPDHLFISCLNCVEGQTTLNIGTGWERVALPLQIQAIRKFRFGHYSIEVGPFLKYQVVSLTHFYKINPLLGGIQIQTGWEK